MEFISPSDVRSLGLILAQQGLLPWLQAPVNQTVWNQPQGHLGKHLRPKEQRFSLVQPNLSMTNSPRELSTSLRLQDSQMGLGGPPLGQSVESTVSSGV